MSLNLKERLLAEFEASGITKSELARRLGVDVRQVRRLLNVRISSNLDSIDAAFKAMGLTARIEVTRRQSAPTLAETARNVRKALAERGHKIRKGVS